MNCELEFIMSSINIELFVFLSLAFLSNAPTNDSTGVKLNFFLSP